MDTPIDQTLTKKQRRELKRQDQAQDRARENRNKKLTTWIIVIALVAVIGGLLYWAATSADNQPNDNTPLVTPTLGGQDAAVVVTEYSDLSCPACATVAPTVRQLATEYGDRIKIVFNSFDIGHQWSQKSLEAGLCANAQNKFWEYSEIAFDKQSEWAQAGDAVGKLKSYAQNAGLNTDQFNTCLDNGDMAQAVEDASRAGVRQGINSTPTFMINDQKIVGAQSLSQFKTTIDAELNTVN